jgi:hypothetical protein
MPTPTAIPTVTEVVVQAGHEGRPASCAAFHRHPCNTGAPGELTWTPIVADETTRVLRAHGISVARIPADFRESYTADAAVFIHFDGNDKPCSTGASIGYKQDDVNRGAADAWRAYYGARWPFKFMPDNFTVNLRKYYGFKQVTSSRGALVIELGEISCAQQKTWLASRLIWAGDLLAHYLSTLIGKGGVPDPGPYPQPTGTPKHA